MGETSSEENLGIESEAPIAQPPVVSDLDVAETSVTSDSVETPVAPDYAKSQAASYGTYVLHYSAKHVAPEKVGMFGAIRNMFTNYANFKGRASRSEFWYAYLFDTLISMFAFIVLFVTLDNDSDAATAFALFVLVSFFAYFCATLVPRASLVARRLHDAGKPGAFYWWLLVPIAGPIIVLLKYIAPSEQADNVYGPGPRAVQ